MCVLNVKMIIFWVTCCLQGRRGILLVLVGFFAFPILMWLLECLKFLMWLCIRHLLDNAILKHTEQRIYEK